MTARILIAEDHPASLELLRYLLAANGYDILSAEDGEAALDLARRDTPDLIICDLQMPKKNGYEVVRQLKSEPALSAIPVVAVTAFSMIGDREQVLAAGFDGYLSKPIEPEEFVALIEQYLPLSLRKQHGGR
ncbi:response regulator [Aromatoleum bremense]|uniref:Response regulator n=1 Tax=Aromatoleum bremense TaxID=76115 RepID=A0ABX1NR76_9RHOO|nr:response regulator [Aromatoleum bremense]NMG14191.1 response regulator [Aromatoleum bremense]QTQ33972.1 Two component system response regulator, CheY-like superfamily [Aromatoleum bremense]